MHKNLFKLTFDVYEVLTTSKDTSFEEVYIFSLYDEASLSLLKEKMNILLTKLEKEMEKNMDTDEKKYLENFKKTCHITSIDTILSDLAGSLFYMSDRWSYERYYAIKWLWNQFILKLKEE
jgi:hypothetical protein